jgi:conserved hypothetical protein YidD
MKLLLVWLLKLPIHAYRYSLSYLIGGRCRFQPTCSVYALQALDRHGPIRGLWLAVTRLGRCHPFSRGGHWQYDPVPDLTPPCPCGDEQPTARTPGTMSEIDQRKPKSGPPKS